jgi:exopolyphosphatase/guanosine-5'-triphosphate,3'-diphosphate pyrophosphatase
MRFGAIDVGSNAVRLLITNVYEGSGLPVFKKESLIRVPVRLGEDAFLTGNISTVQADRPVDTMRAFNLLLKVHGAAGYRACATSAMREAGNGAAVAERVRNETGIDLRIISGQEEAEVIFANHIEERLDPDGRYLYIDVGGGSTELTVFNKGKKLGSRSFPLGTLRVLNNLATPEVWAEMRQWLIKAVHKLDDLQAIGSGGNINKIYKLVDVKHGRPLSYNRLVRTHRELSAMTYDQRVTELGLNIDRADVIVPACEIFIDVMHTAHIKEIIVPQIGLADGLTRMLYDAQVAASKH